MTKAPGLCEVSVVLRAGGGSHIRAQELVAVGLLSERLGVAFRCHVFFSFALVCALERGQKGGKVQQHSTLDNGRACIVAAWELYRAGLCEYIRGSSRWAKSNEGSTGRIARSRNDALKARAASAPGGALARPDQTRRQGWPAGMGLRSHDAARTPGCRKRVAMEASSHCVPSIAAETTTTTTTTTPPHTAPTIPTVPTAPTEPPR